MLWMCTNSSSPCLRITANCEHGIWVCLNPSGCFLTEIRLGGYSLTFVDEFAYELLTEERVCDIILPRIQKRQILEENSEIGPRKSRLLAAMEDETEETRRRSKSRSLDRSPSRSPSATRSRGSPSRSRSRSRSDAGSRYVSRSPSRSLSPPRSPSPHKSESGMDIDGT